MSARVPRRGSEAADLPSAPPGKSLGDELISMICGGLLFVGAVGVILGFIAGAAWLAGGATALGVLR